MHAGTATIAERSERWFFVGWALITAWLLGCAILIGGEFGDGYQTIANARYFFGDNPGYYAQRGPLAALILWPIEVITQAMQLHPVDVRPYHLYSGILHSAYLLGCWLLLKRSTYSTGARLIAFAAAILSVVFFANAPYLSHDLIPGLLFLLMIFLCDRWIREPGIAFSIALVLLGTLVTFIKQTYAIFWVAICLYAVLAFVLKLDGRRVTLKKMLLLFGLAAASAVLSWIGYGWAISGQIPDVPLLARPLKLIVSVSAQYQTDGVTGQLFPWDLYLRNAHNYGIAAMLMVLPGIVLAFRSGDARSKMIAICWLVGFVAIQSIAFREVRYFAFLAPLTAVLVVPVAAWLLKQRGAAAILLGIILGIDLSRSLSMAAAQLTVTPVMNVTRFIGDMPGDRRYISSGALSFAYMAKSPMQHDRYHGIFHLTAELLFRLNEGRAAVRSLLDPRDLGTFGLAPGDHVYYSNQTLARRPPWQAGNVPVGLAELVSISGAAAVIELVFDGSDYRIVGHDNKFVVFVPLPEAGQQMPMIVTGKLTTDQVRHFYGDAPRETLKVLGIVVDALCQADTCRYYLAAD